MLSKSFHINSFIRNFSKVKLIAHTPNPEMVIAIASRLCYSKYDVDKVMKLMSDKNEVKRSIKMLNELNHESPIEHASFTFSIEGISRACMSQLTRHRMASFSVKSQRYVNEKNFKYITPPTLKESERKHYDKIMKKISLMYKELKKKKVLNEDARFILPNACDTQLIMTMNARSLKNFFKLRCCTRAQWEIRDVAHKMLYEVRNVAPLLFEDAGPSCYSGGPCTEGVMGENCPNRNLQIFKKINDK